MNNLAEVVKENVGKGSMEMISFFQDLVKSGTLKAYSVNGRLIPVDRLREHQPFIVEDSTTGSMYALNISSEGGMFYDDGDSQTIYYHCVLEKLAKTISKGLDARTIRFNHGAAVPSDLVSARLRVDYDNDWTSGGDVDYIRATHGRLVVEGENDGLFAKVCEFVRGTPK
ncbi:MAG: hypothetical protein KJ623_03775 [Nanoarchaeota archaeon]|nr:hypothetical protein [Nanoarchaeota archaeon]